MIEVSNLRKNYGSIQALDGISFSANIGEVVGFLGPNGAGKSTTMRILSGFLAPTSGSVRIMGRSVTDSSCDTRRFVGYLPERAPAYLDMTVLDFINWSAALKKVDGPRRKKSVARVLERCGLSDTTNHRISALSKGYRQRVGLAQALVHEPKVLILDEPLSGLDPNQVAVMREVIKEEGLTRTVLFSSHILGDVQAVADRIIILDRGRIVVDRPTQKDGTQSSEITLKVKLTGLDLSDFEGIIGRFTTIKSVEFIELDKEIMTVLVRGKEDIDPREEFLQMITERRWTLIELQDVKTDLETLFRSVTQRLS